MNRRTFLGLAASAGTGAYFARWPGLPGAEGVPSASAVAPTVATAGSIVDLAIRAAPAQVSVLPGRPTRVWQYTAERHDGPTDALTAVFDSYLGPSLRLNTGQRLRIRFRNELPEPTIVHWHGLDVPEHADGHPRLMVGPGGESSYDFPIANRAGTYWYHPHHHHRTGAQVYQGLAGVVIVHDEEERALGLPAGDRDMTFVLQDRTFDRDNQLSYISGMPMEQMSGFFGTTLLVNGRLPGETNVATAAYRLRLLNGSNARVYRLGWNDGSPLTVVGTDGGLLERAVSKPYLTLAPGERAEVIVDFSNAAVGTTRGLRSLAFPQSPFLMSMGGGRGRGRGMFSSSSAALVGPVATFRVSRRERSTFRLPDRLTTFTSDWQPDAGRTTPSRVVGIDFMRMQWLLDGRVFGMNDVAAEETITAGTKAIWEFDNSGSSRMGMRLAHPLHLHGRQFRVLSRDVEPSSGGRDYDDLREGFTDEGWKDTVLVMPGERVRVLIRFSTNPGLYLYHCHNLEHEDMGMMRNYRLV
jgi:FtsP/CotA-like multicopper oxidase with cupredoxin domain